MFKEPIQIIIGLFLWILGTPFLLFLVLWKCAVVLCMKFKFRNSATLYEFTNISDFFGNILSLALVGQGLIDLKQLKSHFYDTFIKDGKDRKYQVFHYTYAHILGFIYKIEAPLDINNHIREEDYDPNESENEAYIRIANDNLKFDGFVPKWEAVLLHNRQEKRSTIIFKISHTLADAYSLTSLMNIFLGTPTPTSYTIAKSKTSMGFPKQFKLFAKLPLQTLLIMINSKKLVSKGLAFLDSNVPQSSSSFCWSKTSMDISIVKEISKKSGYKISAILMSAFLSTLKKSIETWDNIRVANDDNFLYPIPIPNHPAEKGKFCNHVFLGMIGLPLNARNEYKQLEAIQENLTDFESSEPCRAMMLLLKIMNPILPTFALKNIILQQSAFITAFNPIVFSPILECNILGTKATNLYFVCNLDSPIKFRGVILTPITMGDQIHFSFHATRGVFRSMAEADSFLIKMKQEIILLGNNIERN